MCAIVDANVVSEVFGLNRPEAAEKFHEWLNSGSGRMVVGGKLREELDRGSRNFGRWAREARLAGRMITVSDSEVNTSTEEFRREQMYRSNDPHVLALAQVSGARLLYSNDSDLQQDFKNRQLIDNPRGRVYTTSSGPGYDNTTFRPSHKRLLARKDLCPFRH